MDVMIEDEEQEPSIYIIALYALLSFLCAMLLIVLVYVACNKKYKLNWFEKNLLENAENKEIRHSQEALMQDSGPGSSKTLCSTTSENKFWVPPSSIKRQNSVCQSDVEEGDISIEDCSGTGSPTSASSYQPVPFSGPIPLARNDKQIVLTSSSPIRPKVSSMQAKLDHTKIDTSLYQKDSPVETEEVRGSIHVNLVYDPIAGILTVHLVEAQDLQARDFSGTADPYAKIRLLPDKTNVWQTRIHKKTLNPVFDEDFVFEVRAATLGRHTLEILLYDFDAYSRHHSIGGVQMPLANIDLSEKVDVWKKLMPLNNQDSRLDLGELMVSLAYLPSAERLTVVIVKARNLRVVDDTRNSSDPFVKVSLIQGSKRLKKRKTGVQRNTVCPVFNEAFTFDIGKDVLKNCYIEFCVAHDSLLGASELLGKCKIGQTQDCRKIERQFFKEMLTSKTATAQWLPLLDPKTPNSGSKTNK
ncbi:synaptotagmin-1 [Agrilus planipennis]|uniref:Synaptotagmin-1 n=1 Tax=Agrilus planipennis TaxID=224129 RepID=A0A1W4W6B1_AGRPL|nr:synaptotagmin-1 [Agrilus planipennis]XP_018319645.1 synaptotagmin-1 [Agrilus planipennis]